MSQAQIPAGIQAPDEVESARQALASLNLDDKEYIPALDTLASELMSRFALSRHLEDVDEAVSLTKQALDLAPPGHSSHLAALCTMGQAFNMRYRSRGDTSDMTEALSCFEAAMELCTPEEPYFLPLASNLAISRLSRYRTYGDVMDLDRIVETSSTVLSATPATSPNRDALLNNLANALKERFEKLGNRVDLDTALIHYQSCLDLRPPGHPSRHSVLGNLADAILYRFEIDGHLQDLESAASHFAAALELRSPGQDGYLFCLRNLGTVLWRIFNAQGDTEKLESAIGYFQTAMAYSTMPTLEHSRLLDNYSAALQTRHSFFGNIDDLNQAIQYLTTSSDIQPPTYSGRPITLLNLGAALTNRFGETGNIADIDSSVEKLASAIELGGPSYHYRPALLSVYGRALSTRFSVKGDIQDLNLAVSTCKEALTLASPTEVTYPSNVANLTLVLMEHFHKFGNIEECRIIIDHCDHALGFTLPANLASITLKFTRAKAFLQLFQYGREKTDIDTCINAFREIIPALYEGHADYVPVHLQLGIALGTRFELIPDSKDLDESIEIYRVALRNCKRGNMDYVPVCMQLGNVLRKRFECYYDLDDALDEAIVLLTEVEEILTPTPGHSDYKACLVNLGSALFVRFQSQRSKGDLDAAIESMSRALETTTSGDFLIRTNLATLLSARYLEHEDLKDLERCIELFGVAAEQMPPNHLFRGALCRNYGHALFKLGFHRDRLQNFDAAIIFLKEALEHLPSSHFDQPLTCTNLAGVLLERAKLLGDDDGINYGMNLLRTVMRTLSEDSHTFHVVYYTAAMLSMSLYNLSKRQAPSFMEDSFRYYEKAAGYTHLHSYKSVNTALEWAQAAETHHHPSALLAYQTALTSLNQHLLTAASLESRRAALVDTYWVKYTSTLAMDATSCAIARGELALAVELSEQGRGLLWSQLSQSRTPLDDLRSASEEGRLLASDFERVSAELARCAIAQSESSASLTVSRLMVEEARRRYGQSSKELKAIVARIRQQEGFQSFLRRTSFENLKRAALGGPVILVNISSHRCDALIVLHDAPPQLVPLPDPTLEYVTMLAMQLHRGLRATSGVGEEKMRERELVVVLRALWDSIVLPIVDVLTTLVPRGTRIWWCPTSKLALLPLHAAGSYRKGGQNLSAMHVSSYTPTLAALIRARHRPSPPSSAPPPPASFVAISQAKPASGSQLHTVNAELRLVQSLVPRSMRFTALSDDASTADAALAALGTHTWAHVACHGHPNVDQPFDSAFALHDRAVTVLDIVQARSGGDNTHDGHNDNDNDSNHDTRNVNVNADTTTATTSATTATVADTGEFAFLSACHTTVGDRDAPDEIIHLAAAMQFAGFRSVIGTMWAVDDGMAQGMVRAFYEQLSVLARREGGSGGDGERHGDGHGPENGDEEWDCTLAARALNKASKSVDKSLVAIDQRIVFIHIGA